MYDERLDFLPLEPGGASILLVGRFDESLAGRISGLYEQIVIADWDPSRLADMKRMIPGRSVELVELEVGSPELPADKFDLIMVFWIVSYLGDSIKWLDLLVERINPHGRLAIIDCIDRSGTPGQELTRKVMSFGHKADALSGLNIHPGSTSESLLETARSYPLSHVRLRTFTDPDLIVGSDYWRAEATRTLSRVEALVESWRDENQQGMVSDSTALTEMKSGMVELRDMLNRTEPATPPFFLLTGIKRSLKRGSSSRSVEEPTLAETSTTVYAAKLSMEKSDPFERLLLYGPDSLKNQELMSIILRGLPADDRTCLEPDQFTQRLIKEYGTKAISEERNPGRLAEVLGIPQSVACLIVAVFEMGRRFYAEPRGREPVIRGPEDCFNYLRDMGSLKKEHLRGLYLNVQSRLIHDEVISIGTLSRSVVHPREVFAPALEYAANSIILAHNHPSGDLTPSETDIAVTKQLAQAGSIMGIELLDHLIIGKEEYISLKKERII